MEELQQLRTQIDEVDQELVKLLNKRAEISIGIGKSKRILQPDM